MKLILLIPILILSYSTYAQNINGKDLLEKTIKFHDPNNNWSSLFAKMTFEPEERNGKIINRSITIKNTQSFFTYKNDNGEDKTSQTVNGDECSFKLNGSTDISDSLKTVHKLNCERAKRIRNYYTYLYGLPMKLKDPGTIIADTVTQESFMGMNFYKLKVSYQTEVGKDIWFFYINPDSFAMEAYQFYHDDINGKGEYITLEGLIEIEGIKIPKLRKWYTNEEDKFLGTDNLSSIEKL